ncbi:methyl-accepting chemotaxis protein [Archangium lansingense]|uniref:Methyl-accepting chemotaxis protein n=1 Tax=Archangium lansingense TaxID=2995310 RepID=A0ABT4AC99_9BACT|nr:methyl-accepting chemotaxis protein [Archangium lansinium]MCY1079211.1 methyl-accepting chemotaxis protein [Archangium lansinium]
MTRQVNPVDMTDKKQQAALTRRMLLLLLGSNIPLTPFSTYTASLFVGLERPEDVRAVLTMLPLVVVFNASLVLFLVLRWLVRRTFELRPTDEEGTRLVRILKLPSRIAFYCLQLTWFHAGACFMLGVCLMTGQSLQAVIPVTAIATAFGVMVSFPIVPILEHWTMKHALAEQDRLGGTQAAGRGYFWPRQSWYQPYAVASALVSTLFLAGVVMVIKFNRVQEQLVEKFEAQGATHVAEQLRQASGTLTRELGLPFVGLFALVFIFPTLVVALQVWRQSRAMRTVREAIEALAMGMPKAPAWVSTDEAGDMADGMKSVLVKLQEIPLTLSTSAGRLSEAGTSLSSEIEHQRRSLTQQATALQQAQVTSEEIKQTSETAAQKADAVLTVAARVEELGRSGEQALQQSLEGLATIRHFVDGMRDKVSRLGDSTRQLSTITTTVKGIADRSNMLALNASIEAVRSGEHGKGFAVVAREIRGMADQSIQATGRIRDILEDITLAINDAVVMGDQGTLQLEDGMLRIKRSGENFREVSDMVQQSTASVRQISATVRQQNEGVSQIFTAIRQLSVIMEETVSRIDSTQHASLMLKSVSDEVTRLGLAYEHRQQVDPPSRPVMRG